MLNIAIVEDDRASNDLLVEYLKRYREQNSIQLETRQMFDGRELVENYSPHYDIIFMDIDMPDINGMRTAQLVREKDEKVIIVFITNAAHYAVQGYDVGALDFIVKPVSYEMFAFKMKKILKRVERNTVQSILLRANDQMYKVEVSRIQYVEVMNHKLTYHTEDGNISMKASMKEAEKQLGSMGFCKSSSSYLVNLRYVREINNDTVSIGDEQLPISRGRRKEFLDAVAEYIGGI